MAGRQHLYSIRTTGGTKCIPVSANAEPLYHQVCRHVCDPALRDRMHQYLYYSVEDGGELYTPETGISRGYSLSPLMGAVQLRYVDRYFSETEGIWYVRYMDDF